jgi:hypothetical protein
MWKRAFAVAGVLALAGLSGIVQAQTATVTLTYPPDLVIADLSVDADCQIVARVVNSGDAIPTTATNVTMQYWMNGAPIAGRSIDHSNGLDNLRPPGGVLMFTLPTIKISATSTIKAKVDSLGQVRERSESNNEFTKTLSCSPRLPDFSLRLASTTADCRNVIELANLGDAPLMDGGTWGLSVERTVDGIPLAPLSLSTVDPEKKAKLPGAKVTYVEPPEFRAYDSFTYKVDYVWQEKSKTNNSFTGQVPAACRAARPAFDLQPIGIGLGPDCRAVVRVRNNGPGTVPPTWIPANFFKNGSPDGAWTVQLFQPLAPGAAANGLGPSSDRSKQVSWRVVVDPRGQYPESDKSNNEKSSNLYCP